MHAPGNFIGVLKAQIQNRRTREAENARKPKAEDGLKQQEKISKLIFHRMMLYCT